MIRQGAEGWGRAYNWDCRYDSAVSTKEYKLIACRGPRSSYPTFREGIKTEFLDKLQRDGLIEKYKLTRKRS